MKALAILKDSLREAIDTKVFYVMIGLSCLITLVTLTLTFTPRPPNDMVKGFLLLSMYDTRDLRPEHFMGMLLNSDQQLYEIKSMLPLDGAPQGPESTYQITLAAHARTPEEAAKLQAAPGPTEQRIRERLGKLDEMKLLDVDSVRLADASKASGEAPAGNQVLFDVTARPTAAARRLWPHEPSLFFGAVPLSFLQQAPLGFQLYLLEDKVIGGFGAWVAILASVVITSFFIPNMLRKGTIDLLLVKPIYRSALLLYKFLGGLIFIFLNTAVAVLGVWAALGLRSGIWAPSFLLLILVISFFFAILYAASTLFGVLTRSPIAAILLTCAVWFIFWIVGVTYQFFEEMRIHEERDNVPVAERISDNWFAATVGAVHLVTPRTKDLDHLTGMLLMSDLLTDNQIKTRQLDQTRISWGESLTVSGLFIALMLGLSCWWFATRDY